jgi:hypothetical protein
LGEYYGAACENPLLPFIPEGPPPDIPIHHHQYQRPAAYDRPLEAGRLISVQWALRILSLRCDLGEQTHSLQIA